MVLYIKSQTMVPKPSSLQVTLSVFGFTITLACLLIGCIHLNLDLRSTSSYLFASKQNCVSLVLEKTNMAYNFQAKTRLTIYKCFSEIIYGGWLYINITGSG